MSPRPPGNQAGPETTGTVAGGRYPGLPWSDASVAPQERDARRRRPSAARKNNWRPDHRDYYALPQAEIQIERTHPVRGYKHVVTVAQLREFISLLPDWDELARGLQAISIYEGGHGWLGLWNPGVVVISAWEKELWWQNIPSTWVSEHAELLHHLGVEIVVSKGDEARCELRWTEAQARGFMLLGVLVHELGHHHDAMTTRGRDAPRGEPYAIGYERRVGAEVWPEYARRFDL